MRFLGWNHQHITVLAASCTLLPALEPNPIKLASTDVAVSIGHPLHSVVVGQSRSPQGIYSKINISQKIAFPTFAPKNHIICRATSGSRDPLPWPQLVLECSLQLKSALQERGRLPCSPANGTILWGES